MDLSKLHLKSRKPGLFITATDTGVGKTVVACSIIAAIRQQHPNLRIGVFKPMSSGCRHEREGLVHEDAEALAYFSKTLLPLDIVNPIRYAMPVAPAVAAAQEKQAIDWEALQSAWCRVQETSDFVIVEGAGGVYVPINPENPKQTMVDLMLAMGLPAVVVTRCQLGTLNHSCMTAKVLESHGVRIAGFVMNGYNDTDTQVDDPSVRTNRKWIEKMTSHRVLTVLPRMTGDEVAPERAILDETLIQQAQQVDWLVI